MRPERAILGAFALIMAELLFKVRVMELPSLFLCGDPCNSAASRQDPGSFCFLLGMAPGRALMVIVSFLIFDVFVGAAISQDDVAFVIQGIRAGREKLYRGQFRAHGHFRDRDRQLSNTSSDVFSAFDYRSGNFRFDRRSGTGHGGQFARTPEAVSVFATYGDTAAILPPGERAPSWCKPFDARAVGLAYRHDFEHAASMEEILGHFTRHPGKLASESNGVVELVWEVPLLPQGKHKRVLVCDSRKDYIPVQLTTWNSGDKDGKIGSSDWNVQVVPIEINGVWVPAEVTIKEKDRSEYYKLNWESVNQPLDDSVFSIDGFNLSGARIVTDSRLGPTIVVKKLGTESPLSKGGMWLSWVAALGLALIIVAWFYVRQRVLIK